MIKKISQEDILSASKRVSLDSAARAAAVLHVAVKYLEPRLGRDFFWHPKTWKGGVLRIEVENSAAALRVYAEAEELLRHLREQFPEFTFREVRTEMVSKGSQR